MAKEICFWLKYDQVTARIKESICILRPDMDMTHIIQTSFYMSIVEKAYDELTHNIVNILTAKIWDDGEGKWIDDILGIETQFLLRFAK